MSIKNLRKITNSSRGVHILLIKIWVLTNDSPCGELNLIYSGLPSSKESVYQCRRYKRCGFNPWVRKIPWRRKWQPTPVFLLENPMDRGGWWATVCGITKSQTTEQLSIHTCTNLSWQTATQNRILLKKLGYCWFFHFQATYTLNFALSEKAIM